jgi:hypothetical protein
VTRQDLYPAVRARLEVEYDRPWEYQIGAAGAALNPLPALYSYAAAAKAATDEEVAALRALGCNDLTIGLYLGDATRTPFPAVTWLRYMRRCLEENRACVRPEPRQWPTQPEQRAYHAYEVALYILSPPVLGLNVDVLA